MPRMSEGLLSSSMITMTCGGAIAVAAIAVVEADVFGARRMPAPRATISIAARRAEGRRDIGEPRSAAPPRPLPVARPRQRS